MIKMLGIKKCSFSRQRLECNHSGVEGSLIRPFNNARFLYKKNDTNFLTAILEECVD